MSISHNIHIRFDRRYGYIAEFGTRSDRWNDSELQLIPYISTRHRVIIDKLRAISCYIGLNRVVVPTIILCRDPCNLFNSTSQHINNVEMKMIMFVNNKSDMYDIIDVNSTITLDIFDDIYQFQDMNIWNRMCNQLFRAIGIAIRIDTHAHLFNIGYMRCDLNHQLLYIGNHNFQDELLQSATNRTPIPNQLDVVNPSWIEEYMRIVRRLIIYISQYGIIDNRGLNNMIVNDVITNITSIIMTYINDCNIDKIE